MTIFKELINIWKSDDLLSQAWDESIEMLRFSEKIFDKSIEASAHISPAILGPMPYI